MSERAAMERSERGPATVESLVADLRALGLADGETAIVHSSLSSLGWVCGGAHAVVLALTEVIGRSGTLVMPAHSGGLTDPAAWENPPVPDSTWVDVIRAHQPAYDSTMTPTRRMGAVVECFRTAPGAVRSAHPHVSFTARGPHAELICANHRLEDGFGETSPLALLYDLDAAVVLLGVDHGSNTSLHLAEHRATWPGKRLRCNGAPVLVEGSRRWVAFEEVDDDADDFAALGEAFAAETGAERCGPVGAGQGRLVRQQAIVDYAVGWIERQRSAEPS